MKSMKKWMAVAGVGLALMALTAAALPVAAADTVAAPAAHGVGVRGGGVDDENLALALGVTADELEAAKQTAYQAAIDQAVAEGLITQAQADAIAERAATSGRLSSRYLRDFVGSGDSAIDVDALLADALGVTTDELAAARSEAQSLALAAAVEAGDITQEQADQMQAEQALKTYLDEQGYETQVQSLYENMVQQAVQAGVITQEQADAILSDSHGFGLFGARGARGGHGGMRGGPGVPDLSPNGSTSGDAGL
jgi:hypothetical protein